VVGGAEEDVGLGLAIVLSNFSDEEEDVGA